MMNAVHRTLAQDQVITASLAQTQSSDGNTSGAGSKRRHPRHTSVLPPSLRRLLTSGYALRQSRRP